MSNKSSWCEEIFRLEGYKNFIEKPMEVFIVEIPLEIQDEALTLSDRLRKSFSRHLDACVVLKVLLCQNASDDKLKLVYLFTGKNNYTGNAESGVEF